MEYNKAVTYVGQGIKSANIQRASQEFFDSNETVNQQACQHTGIHRVRQKSQHHNIFVQ